MPLLDEICRGLGLPSQLILGVARQADHAYKEYGIPKRGGGTRLIEHPSRPLKALQRWLLKRLIGEWPVHACAIAYRKGYSIRDNADPHRTSRFLLRVDIQDFFPSITREDIHQFLWMTRPHGTEGWDDQDRDLFLHIVCRRERLTIGAPSSPALSNAVCLALDTRLAAVAADANVRYTRYADDLYFSTLRPEVLGLLADRVQEVVESIPVPGGLRINHAKTWHSSKKGRRVVTGLILGSDGRISLGRSRKRLIRSQVYRYAESSPEGRAGLAGLLAFAKSIEPDFINALVLKYGVDRVRAAQLGVAD